MLRAAATERWLPFPGVRRVRPFDRADCPGTCEAREYTQRFFVADTRPDAMLQRINPIRAERVCFCRPTLARSRTMLSLLLSALP
jgi:hypothetical protein